jgi:hypothetical protein
MTMLRAGDRPPHVQRGMVLADKKGQEWRVSLITMDHKGGGGQQTVARLLPVPARNSLLEPCEYIREHYVLAEDFEDGD